jgi:hypothetical protein
MPSVTSILSVINKPALMNWAAKVEREMVLKVAADLYEDLAGTPKLNRLAWFTTIENRLGKEKAAKKELEKAGEIGTQAHELIEWTLKGKLGIVQGPRPKAVDKAEWAFMSWEDWAKSVNLKPIFIEQVVYSAKYGYAGTMDLYCELEVSGLIEYFNRKTVSVPPQLIGLAGQKKTVTAIPDWKTGKAVYAEAHLQNAAYRQAFREMGHGDAEIGLIVRLPKIETDPEFEVVLAGDEKELFPDFLHAKSLWMWAQKGEAAYQAKKKAQQPEKDSAQAPIASQPEPPTVPPVNAAVPQDAAKPATTVGNAASTPPKRTRKSAAPRAQIPAWQGPRPEERSYQATDEDIPF